MFKRTGKTRLRSFILIPSPPLSCPAEETEIVVYVCVVGEIGSGGGANKAQKKKTTLTSLIIGF